MQQSDADASQSLMPVKRRGLLAGIGGAALIAGSGVSLDTLIAATAPVGTPPAAFVATSRFVTGSALADEAAIARAWSQLVALDAGFAAAVDHLHAAVGSVGLANMSAFLASPLGKDAALLKTVETITSAWYLGYTGTPGDHVVKDDTGFVTFAGALMWRPTIDATVIPTYARGGTDYWVNPPEGTPKPAGKPGVSTWQGSASAPHDAKKA